jgi:hypothetical protein
MEMRRWGDGEMGRWGDLVIPPFYYITQNLTTVVD